MARPQGRRGIAHWALVYLGVRDDPAVRPPLQEDDDGLVRYLVRYAVVGAMVGGAVVAVALVLSSAGVSSPPWWMGSIVGAGIVVVRLVVALRRSD